MMARARDGVNGVYSVLQNLLGSAGADAQAQLRFVDARRKDEVEDAMPRGKGVVVLCRLRPYRSTGPELE